MQCECDDTIDDPTKPSKICKKHFAWVERIVLLEREACAKIADAMFNLPVVARAIRERTDQVKSGT